jgi:fructose-bisphosphate aldolase class II
MENEDYNDTLALLDNSVKIENGHVDILDQIHLRETIHRLAEVSALESGPRQGYARYLTRLIAITLGILPASIHELYMARGQGKVPPTFTVAAMNLRSIAFDSACSVFRAARRLEAGALIFEIARSEMGYTNQRPAEYTTSILAAAICEGYSDPVFIQGDHFQVSAKKYAANPESEVQSVKDVTKEAIAAGFFNIDIDTSTLVDLTKKTIPEQQALNTSLSAMYTALIRQVQPQGVTVSVGGEIGEVGGHNSTEEELRGYMDGYLADLEKLAPGEPGISKISIQTGTSHGGVVLPDGSIAEVSVDFNTLKHLSQVARKSYGLAGAVQHGASTLPESAFGHFRENEACEVHLATNFMNMLYDRLPADLKAEMYAYLDKNNASDRKMDMTDEQFYYKTRKNAIGPFKARLWNLPAEKKAEVGKAWEEQFFKLFSELGLKGTRKYIQQYIHPIVVKPSLKFYLGEAIETEDVSKLAD